MEFTDYMIWKLVAFAVLAFVWGIYCGIVNRPLGGEQRDSQSD